MLFVSKFIKPLLSKINIGLLSKYFLLTAFGGMLLCRTFPVPILVSDVP